MTTPAPLVPVSWGEVIDKITILRIKAGRITRPAALANVQTELQALEAIAASVLAGEPALQSLEARLATVNALRASEAAADFGPQFVALARSVYKLNDERAALKRTINDIVGSSIVEEKSYHAG
jgi:predicted  nucleic acid-binding Zn-ribbon protein